MTIIFLESQGAIGFNENKPGPLNTLNFMSITDTAEKTLNPTIQERVLEADLDAYIVEQVQAGEVAEYDKLVKKYRERIYSVIYNMTSNREDAADIAQEVFVKAFRSIHKFKMKSSFFTWLYRIAINTTTNFLRKNRARRFFSFEVMDEEGFSDEFRDVVSSNETASRSSFLTELQEKLNEALQKLSIKHRTVVILHEIEGLPLTEIATIVRSSEGTVRSRLHYAKKELQEHLKEYLGRDI